ncbi:892_t:CDS:2 [Paraglomus occultum]|uniref:892_t:CDS:1 n=1 Tax=Paraglomus occultum TaxID=144539 RepID=A0A9N9AQR7_9GLOM|nr:892_t:CDS:2 [Paraglomus occultum]
MSNQTETLESQQISVEEEDEREHINMMSSKPESVNIDIPDATDALELRNSAADYLMLDQYENALKHLYDVITKEPVRPSASPIPFEEIETDNREEISNISKIRSPDRPLPEPPLQPDTTFYTKPITKPIKKDFEFRDIIEAFDNELANIRNSSFRKSRAKTDSRPDSQYTTSTRPRSRKSDFFFSSRRSLNRFAPMREEFAASYAEFNRRNSIITVLNYLVREELKRLEADGNDKSQLQPFEYMKLKRRLQDNGYKMKFAANEDDWEYDLMWVRQIFEDWQGFTKYPSPLSEKIRAKQKENSLSELAELLSESFFFSKPFNERRDEIRAHFEELRQLLELEIRTIAAKRYYGPRSEITAIVDRFCLRNGHCKRCGQEMFYENRCQLCEWRNLKLLYGYITVRSRKSDDFTRNAPGSVGMKTPYVGWINFERLKDFEIIGTGGFATVLSATWLDGSTMVWDKDENMYQSTDACRVVLRQLHSTTELKFDALNEIIEYLNRYCPQLGVNYLGISQDIVSKDFVIVTEYADKGSLHNFIQTSFADITWKMRIRILRDIAKDLVSIHSQGIVHRDIHSGNVLIYNSVDGIIAKLSDVGFTGPMNDVLSNVHGVLPYCAPEILRGRIYTTAADIYSFGMIMWEVSSGMRPFATRGHDEVLAFDLGNRHLRPEAVEGAPKCFVKLMQRCWHHVASKRPSAQQLYTMLQKWMRYESDGSQYTMVVPKGTENSFLPNNRSTITNSINWNPDLDTTIEWQQLEDADREGVRHKIENQQESPSAVYISKKLDYIVQRPKSIVRMQQRFSSFFTQ